MTDNNTKNTAQIAVGIGVLVIGLALAAGAIKIPSAAGYGGIGPNFLPWLAAAGLTLCGALIVRESLTGGFRELEEPSGSQAAYWPALVWVSAGLLLNAALITTIGFILSCTLCYMLAVQGLKRASGLPAARPRALVADLVTGLLISAPVYWMFTKFLAINLPGLTQTGWI
ncbi:tripartite tricarboxylate transporter TctB family protein [Caenimonas koreensis]|uniref:tripartite tricarboxylate transporter TctB family protein n=1 Tax=Caenimonas koreensis TaxID=367474 RepID=UPI003784D992